MRYAVYEKAQDELRELQMKEGYIDQYIADFERPAHRAGMGINDLNTLHLFSTGLPLRLAEECIKLDNPLNFEQWAKAARRQQRNWILIQSIKAQRGDMTPQSSQPQRRNPRRGQFF